MRKIVVEMCMTRTRELFRAKVIDLPAHYKSEVFFSLSAVNQVFCWYNVKEAKELVSYQKLVRKEDQTQIRRFVVVWCFGCVLVGTSVGWLGKFSQMVNDLFLTLPKTHFV